MKLGINCVSFFPMRQLTCLPCAHDLEPPGTWHVENTGVTDFCRHPWKYLSNNLDCLWSDQQLLFLVTHGWFFDGKLNLKSVGSAALWPKTAQTEIWHNFALHQLSVLHFISYCSVLFLFPTTTLFVKLLCQTFCNLKTLIVINIDCCEIAFFILSYEVSKYSNVLKVSQQKWISGWLGLKVMKGEGLLGCMELEPAVTWLCISTLTVWQQFSCSLGFPCGSLIKDTSVCLSQGQVVKS